MGERRPFWFKASSGTELGGFVTLPPKRSAKNLPTVLIAHGGPLGIADRVGHFRFLGKQRSAIPRHARLCGRCRSNYRGSGGRGKKFEESGNMQRGIGMLQDILDGVAMGRWTRATWTRTASASTVGAYGGYTALMQPVYAPQGAVQVLDGDYAGVADIRIQADRSDTRRSRAGRNFLRAAVGQGRSGLRRGELRRSTTSTNSMCRC